MAKLGRSHVCSKCYEEAWCVGASSLMDKFPAGKRVLELRHSLRKFAHHVVQFTLLFLALRLRDFATVVLI